jgi:hypothetical protein
LNISTACSSFKHSNSCFNVIASFYIDYHYPNGSWIDVLKAYAKSIIRDINILASWYV